MGLIEDLLKDNKNVIDAFLKLLEGKQAKAELTLDGVALNVGKSKIQLEGKIVLKFTPLASRD